MDFPAFSDLEYQDIFSAPGIFHIRKLFLTFMVTSPICIFGDSENHLPVLEGAEDRAPWGSLDYTDIKRKCLSGCVVN